MNRIADLMTPQPWTVQLDDSLAVARQMLVEREIHHLPVVNEGEAVGMVTDRDLMADRLGTVAEVMVPVHRVSGDTPIDEVLEVMATNRLDAVVVTRRGSVDGIFTTSDVVRVLREVVRARGSSPVLDTSGVTTARASRRFDATAPRVFDAFLEPTMIEQWFGPGLGEIERIAVAPRVGGTFSIVQRRAHASVEHRGRYLELERPHRLVFTWNVPPEMVEGVVAISIEPRERGVVVVTINHQLAPTWGGPSSATEEAWARMLDALAIALE